MSRSPVCFLQSEYSGLCATGLIHIFAIVKVVAVAMTTTPLVSPRASFVPNIRFIPRGMFSC